jgi:hypothetical protein
MTEQAQALISDHPFEADYLWPDNCGHVRDDGFICLFGREVHGEPEVAAAP